jgi:16S rRNA (guanine(966)-N(2))-methyltransferase RsmD
MRIISGKCRGRTIVPPRKLKARPTTDFAKENLFNILGNRYDFSEMDILDLFSGTGSISYEFASRGAKSVTAVEINTLHHSFIVDTARNLGLTQIYAVNANVHLYLKSCHRKFDIVFADAPYDMKGVEELPSQIFEAGVLKDGGLLIFEHSSSHNFWEHPNFCEIRTYGSVNFSIFKLFSEKSEEAIESEE